jgi:hypothetical protein
LVSSKILLFRNFVKPLESATGETQISFHGRLLL